MTVMKEEKPVNRKTYRKSFYYKGVRYFAPRADTEEEAIANLVRMQDQVISNDLIRTTNRTVRSWAEEAVATYKVRQSEITRQKYVEKMEMYILRYIGDKRIADITPIECQQILNRQSDKSQSIINTVCQQLQFIFSTARINRLISYDPAENLIKPTGYYHPRRSLTAEEERVFLEVLPLHPCALYFALMYYAGCRPSEAASIEGRDIINKGGRRYLHIRGTKTKAADRFVPIVPQLAEFLPDNPGMFRVLCTSRRGTPLNKESKHRAWEYLTRLMNIEMGATLYRNQLIEPLPLAKDLQAYCLRHTFCTNLQKQGVDIRTAQYLMGHSDIKMTANIYTHIDFELIDVAAARMVPIVPVMEPAKIESP